MKTRIISIISLLVLIFASNGRCQSHTKMQKNSWAAKNEAYENLSMEDFCPKDSTSYQLINGSFYTRIIIEEIDSDYREKYIKQVIEKLGEPYNSSEGTLCVDSLYTWPIFEDFGFITGGFYDLNQVWFCGDDLYTMGYCSWLRNMSELSPANGVEPIYRGWIHFNHFPSWRNYQSDTTMYEPEL